MPTRFATLNDLLKIQDELEDVNEWAYQFVTDLGQKLEETPEMTLTTKQFKKLIELHEQYCQ